MKGVNKDSASSPNSAPVKSAVSKASSLSNVITLWYFYGNLLSFDLDPGLF